MNNKTQNDTKKGSEARKDNKSKKSKSVRFAPEPQVIEVESYKKYNRDVSNNAGFCQSCSLI